MLEAIYKHPGQINNFFYELIKMLSGFFLSCSPLITFIICLLLCPQLLPRWQFKDWRAISNKCQLVKEMNEDSLVDLSLDPSAVFALLRLCPNEWLNETVKDGERERDSKTRSCAVLTGRWSPSLSPEVFHFTLHYTRLFPSARCLSVTALQHPLPLALLFPIHCSPSRFLSSLHACLLCWLRVKCQVQSRLTGPLWRVRGCKTSKVMSPYSLPFSHTTPCLHR